MSFIIKFLENMFYQEQEQNQEQEQEQNQEQENQEQEEQEPIKKYQPSAPPGPETIPYAIPVAEISILQNTKFINAYNKTFTNTVIKNGTYNSCKFFNCYIKNSTLISCKFTNCSVENCETNSCNNSINTVFN